jgi:hypothetical protein
MPLYFFPFGGSFTTVNVRVPGAVLVVYHWYSDGSIGVPTGWHPYMVMMG